MKIYLAGPMRGIEDMNRPRFAEAADQLRSYGHTVFNPGEHQGTDLRASLAIDVAWICNIADVVVMLEGWEKSLGASAEGALAAALALPTWRYELFVQQCALESVKLR